MPTPQVTDAYADERIAAKISLIAEKPRTGLDRISRELKTAGIPPHVRLHLPSAVTDLGRVAHTTLPARLARHALPNSEKRWD